MSETSNQLQNFNEMDHQTGPVGKELVLYASGSNSHGQLGTIINDQEDIRGFQQTQKWHLNSQDCNDVDSPNKNLNEESNFSISSSHGGRHSLFLIKVHNDKSSNPSEFRSYLYSCGDSSQGQSATQFEVISTNSQSPSPIKLSSGWISSENNLNEAMSENQHGQNYCRNTLKEIDYKKIISKVSNIDEGLKKTLLQKYQPVQVAACWETSFIVLSSSKTINDSNETILGNQIDIKEGYTEMECDDDYIIAFGSNDFDLRGSKDLLEDVKNPNLINLPTSNSPINTFKKIKLFCGCKHLIAMVSNTMIDGNCVKIELIGWGAARHGQLGPMKDKTKMPKSIKPTLLSISIPKLSNSSSIQIALGNQHTVIVCPEKIWCWGSNKNHQIPTQLSNLEPKLILELKATWNATFLIISTDQPGFNKLLGFGNNNFGQLGIKNTYISYMERLIDSSFYNLSTGSEHFLLINKFNNQVWGWGWNEHFNLSQFNNLNQSFNLFLPFKLIFQSKFLNLVVHHVSAGCATSFIFLK